MALVRELPSPARRSLWDRISQLLTPQRSWAYAAVPAMAVLLLAFWPRPGSEPAVPQPTVGQPVQVAQVTVTAPALLGTIEAADPSVTVGGKRLTGSGELREGSEILIESASGAATLQYTDGTRIRLENRARAKAGARSLQLLEGRALAAVSHTGKGFEVKSCFFTTRVMGTRFMVDSARCEVQLLEGKVETFEARGPANALTAGQGVVHEPGRARRRELSAGEKRELTVAFLRFEGAPKLAASLGMTEDGLREYARPPRQVSPEPPASATAAPASPAADGASTVKGQPDAGKPAPFVPVQGLMK